MTESRRPRADRGRTANQLLPEDRAAHDWYRFVLSFPPHLVRDYLTRFGLDEGQVVLDPFAGTGTTLVECKKLGLRSGGLEANPMACFAAQVKTDWSVDPDALCAHAARVAEEAARALAAQGIPPESDTSAGFPPSVREALLRTLPPEQAALLLRGSISPLPLHRILVLLETLSALSDRRFSGHERLALARAVVLDASNLRFGPEIGLGPERDDAPVLGEWLRAVRTMAEDLHVLRKRAATAATIHQADAREPRAVLEPESVDAVITSPPYPNEKDYTRTTRLESVLLGFIRSKAELRGLKQGLLRSNTRGVYRGDSDDQLVAGHPEIERLAREIEERRVALRKTSGFERLYARVTRLYFGGMARHLTELRAILRPGAKLAYVVGDQASFLRVLLRTGQLLCPIAESLGYEVTGLDLFRTRTATATGAALREEVMVLRWPGAGA
jgi:DNA modification methylase